MYYMKRSIKKEQEIGKIIVLLVLLRFAFTAVVCYLLFKAIVYFLTGK